MEPRCLRLAILASGRGSNFLAILEALKQGRLHAQIKVLISDQPDASALQKAGYATDPEYARKLSDAINSVLRAQRAQA